RSLNVLLTEQEIQQRLENWRKTPPIPKVTSGFLQIYATNVNSARYGAYFK
ncbi:MAG: hypothetical protein EU533_06710, partial [Promethearchaeota archaeon]